MSRILLFRILIFAGLCTGYVHSSEHIHFELKEEKLIDAINKFAALKGVNLLFPENQEGLQVKVNYTLDKRISVNEAWELLEMILHMAQFSIVPRGEFYAIVPSTDTTTSPLPLWVNVPIDVLPDGSNLIRFLYSFVNLNIGDKSGGAKANLQRILKDMLPGPADKVALFDENSNSIILTGQTSVIKSLMSLIKELDKSGFREAIDVIDLKHASAAVVEKIIKELIPAAETNAFRYPVSQQSKPGRATYFAKTTQIVSIANSNSLAIMGKIEAVERLANFIRDYLDTPEESTRTLLHVKHLNNLDAEIFASELQGLLKRRVAGDQSKGKTAQDNLLKDVIIVPEKIQRANTKDALKDEFAASVGVKIQASGDKTVPASGGNNLIIAARETDWKLINDIITQLDRPKLQVALEVLVVDVQINDTHILGAQNRGVGDPCKDVDSPAWQTAHLTKPVLEFDGTGSNATVKNPPGLNANLLQSGTAESNQVNNIAALATSGTTILSFKDKNGMRTVVEALESYEYATILSQPFVVTSNHKSATIYVGENKRFDMGLDTASTGGPAVQNVQDLDAALAVGIQPHISTSGQRGNINLEIIVRSSEFSPSGDGSTRFTRTIRTNSNVKNQDVLVIGGLTKVTTQDSQSTTPPLSRIPIIGSLFFKKRNRNFDRQNLMVFISPTIIHTRPTGGADSYTLRKEQQIKEKFEQASENFDILQDPITRTFFSPITKGITNDVDYYMKSGVFTEGGQKNFDQIIKKQTEELAKQHAADPTPKHHTPVYQVQKPQGTMVHQVQKPQGAVDQQLSMAPIPTTSSTPIQSFKDTLADKPNPFTTPEADGSTTVSSDDSLESKLKQAKNPFKQTNT